MRSVEYWGMYGSVEATHICEGDGARGSRDGRLGEVDAIRGPQLVPKEARGIDDGIPTLDSSLGSVTRCILQDAVELGLFIGDEGL